MGNSPLAMPPPADTCDVMALIGYIAPQNDKIVVNNADLDKIAGIVTPYEMPVRDVRTAGIECFDMGALDESGFAFIKHDGTMAINEQVFADNTGLAASMETSAYSSATLQYLDEVARHIKAVSGAREVLPQVRGLLSRASKRNAAAAFYKPAGFVHIDYTAEYAENQVLLAWEHAGAEAKPYSRFVLYQTWRAISGVPQDSALAICDGRSASLADDGRLLYTVLPVDPPGNVVHTRIPKYNPAHAWYYLSNMQPDDLLVFPGYDSARPNAMSGLHVAFDNPLASADAEPRRSIEARFVALFAGG